MVRGFLDKLMNIPYGLFVLFIFTVASNSIASGDVALSGELKAAFIYNFAKFTDWPEEIKDGKLNVCMYGLDDMENAFNDKFNKTVRGNKLSYVKVRKDEELDLCQILFVSESETRKLNQIIRSTQGRSILTISLIDGFVEAGGMINLVWVGKKLRFKVNKVAADKEDITISARLLKLANEVIE